MNIFFSPGEGHQKCVYGDGVVVKLSRSKYMAAKGSIETVLLCQEVEEIEFNNVALIQLFNRSYILDSE